MTANNANVDILSRSLNQVSTSQPKKSAIGQEGDTKESFKSHIDNQQATAKKQVAGPEKGEKYQQSRPQDGSTETNDQAKTKSTQDGDNTAEQSAAPTDKPTANENDGDKTEFAEATSTIAINEIAENEVDERIQLSLPPVATAGQEGGNALPLNARGPEELTTGKEAVMQSNLGKENQVTSQVHPVSETKSASTKDITSEELVNNKVVDQVQVSRTTQTAPAEGLAPVPGTVVPSTVKQATNSQDNNRVIDKQNTESLSANTVKLTGASETDDELSKEAFLKSSNAKATTATTSLTSNTTLSSTNTNAQTSQSGPKQIELPLDNTIEDTADVEVGLEKANQSANVQTTKPGATIDQSWLQQLQSVHGLSASGKNAAVQLQLPLNVHNPQWFAAMADRVSWLASQAIQAAEIHLDPPELGPLQVRIAVNQDQASVNFISHHSSVRDMLDAQVLRLRELFSSEGLNLVDVNVSDQQQQQTNSDAESSGGRQNTTNDADLNNGALSSVPINTIQNWVDYYV